MKIFVQVFCIISISFILGFSIIATATDAQQASSSMKGNAFSSNLAKVQPLPNDTPSFAGSGLHTEKRQDNLIVSVPSSQNSSSLASFSLPEAGSMLLLGIMLVLVAGLGRKLLNKID